MFVLYLFFVYSLTSVCNFISFQSFTLINKMLPLGSYRDGDAAGVICEALCAHAQLLGCNALLHAVAQEI